MLPILTLFGLCCSLLITVVVMRLMYMTKSKSPWVFVIWMVCISSIIVNMILIATCIKILLLLV